MWICPQKPTSKLKLKKLMKVNLKEVNKLKNISSG